LRQGLAFHQHGQLDQAELIYREILTHAPDYFDALHLLGVIEGQRGNAAGAMEWISQAIRINPYDASAHSDIGNALLDLKRPEEALASYDRALVLKPDFAGALNNRGNALLELKRPEEALASYDRALALKPDFAGALNGRGNALLELKRPEEALASYDRALKLQPDSVEALNNRGNALLDLKRPEEALASFGLALRLKPDYVDAINGCGKAMLDLERPEEALASYDRALKLQPDSIEALNDRGNALLELKRREEALASYDRALKLQPDFVEALNNRGNVLLGLKRREEALASYDRALKHQPDHVEALNNRGIALLDLKRLEEALASYNRALALMPDFAGALNGRGNALLDLRRPEEALASYDSALAIKPDYAEALHNRGIALLQLRRYEEGIADYKKLLAIEPFHDYARGRLLHMQLHCCDWTQYEQNSETLVKSVNDGKRAGVPFSFLAVSQSAADQLRCAHIYVADKYPAASQPVWRGERYSHDRIRLAYLSADFLEHPSSFLLAGMFENHDRSRLETIAISFGDDDQSEIRSRLRGAFEHFIDVRNRGNLEVARLMRELEVDIAVDLMGHTQYSRTGILALRPAPVQVNYLGFPGTMGAEYMDYIIADRHVIPEDQRQYFSEHVVYLPDTFQANDSKRRIAEHAPSRAEVGLPDDGFVFCSFNKSYKISPTIFDVWMRLLKAVTGSVLWLVADNLTVENNLRRGAANQGIEPRRLIFAPRLQYADHLARFQLADLFLDTLPFNAGATASDALWTRVPVLTCAGEAFASRMAGSLLNAIGLPELITHNLEDYEALAHKLVTRPAMLNDIRATLAKNRHTHSLFNSDRFRRHIEAAYTTMWERHQRGARPASFSVQPFQPPTSE
jgi:predicted O-linked N-acetylglucosamine transferase (SPINDLY family)